MSLCERLVKFSCTVQNSMILFLWWKLYIFQIVKNIQLSSMDVENYLECYKSVCDICPQILLWVFSDDPNSSSMEFTTKERALNLEPRVWL